MTTWTPITKASGTPWTKVPKAITRGTTALGGSPIGLLLALTYSASSPGTGWTPITKPSGTSWTKITKAT